MMKRRPGLILLYAISLSLVVGLLVVSTVQAQQTTTPTASPTRTPGIPTMARPVLALANIIAERIAVRELPGTAHPIIGYV